jgi:hypothetical protein
MAALSSWRVVWDVSFLQRLFPGGGYQTAIFRATYASRHRAHHQPPQGTTIWAEITLPMPAATHQRCARRRRLQLPPSLLHDARAANVWSLELLKRLAILASFCQNQSCAPLDCIISVYNLTAAVVPNRRHESQISAARTPVAHTGPWPITVEPLLRESSANLCGPSAPPLWHLDFRIRFRSPGGGHPHLRPT